MKFTEQKIKWTWTALMKNHHPLPHFETNKLETCQNQISKQRKNILVVVVRQTIKYIFSKTLDELRLQLIH